MSEFEFDNEILDMKKDDITKYEILNFYFKMMHYKEEYMGSKLNKTPNMVFYDKWISGLIIIYDFLKDEIEFDINITDKNDYKKTKEFMDRIKYGTYRPSVYNLTLSTEQITSYLKLIKILKIERVKYGKIKTKKNEKNEDEEEEWEN